MNRRTYNVLTWVRQAVLLSSGLCLAYVGMSILLIYVISPIEACNYGRCYTWNNWDFIIRRFGGWHLAALFGCAAVFVVTWKSKLQPPKE